jgi:hypothetical protein
LDTLNGVHSSKTSAMSEPSAAWISIEVSGARNFSEPSMWLRKRTPSSVMPSVLPWRSPPPCAARPLISSATVPWPIEKTWKPPESVMIGCSQRMKSCSPPRPLMRSWPGSRNR